MGIAVTFCLGATNALNLPVAYPVKFQVVELYQC